MKSTALMHLFKSKTLIRVVIGHGKPGSHGKVMEIYSFYKISLVRKTSEKSDLVKNVMLKDFY